MSEPSVMRAEGPALSELRVHASRRAEAPGSRTQPARHYAGSDRF
jgi:hypothetical protein